MTSASRFAHTLLPTPLLCADVKLWDIVAELVEVCTVPSPVNPFSVDFDYFDQYVRGAGFCLCPSLGAATGPSPLPASPLLPPHQPARLDKERGVLASGAMIHLLLRILHHGNTRFRDAGPPSLSLSSALSARSRPPRPHDRSPCPRPHPPSLSAPLFPPSFPLTAVHRDVLRLTQIHFRTLQSLQHLGRVASASAAAAASTPTARPMTAEAYRTRATTNTPFVGGGGGGGGGDGGSARDTPMPGY